VGRALLPSEQRTAAAGLEAFVSPPSLRRRDLSVPVHAEVGVAASEGARALSLRATTGLRIWHVSVEAGVLSVRRSASVAGPTLLPEELHVLCEARAVLLQRLDVRLGLRIPVHGLAGHHAQFQLAYFPTTEVGLQLGVDGGAARVDEPWSNTQRLSLSAGMTYWPKVNAWGRRLGVHAALRPTWWVATSPEGPLPSEAQAGYGIFDLVADLGLTIRL
jgi:hypothetical protein